MDPLTFLTTTQHLLTEGGLTVRLLQAIPRPGTEQPDVSPVHLHVPLGSETQRVVSGTVEQDPNGILHLFAVADDLPEVVLALFVPEGARKTARVVGPADAPFTLPPVRRAPGLFVNLAHPLITRALGLPDLYDEDGTFEHGRFPDGRLLPVRPERRETGTDALNLPVLTTLGWINAFAPQDMVSAGLHALRTARGFAPVPGADRKPSGLYADHQFIVAVMDRGVMIADLVGAQDVARRMQRE